MSTFVEVQGVERFVKLLELAKLDMKKHQQSGVAWMLSKEKDGQSISGVQGGINADEMGLGKTIMMIGTIVGNFKRRTLIVVPLALLEQWRSELFRITGHEALVYHGIAKREYDIEMISAAPIVLTTYGHVRYAETKSVIHKIKWDRIVCDEAHHMRNPKSKIFRGVKMLQSSIRWLLTGTPIQNAKRDLYSLFDVLGFSENQYRDQKQCEKLITLFVLKRTKQDAGVFLPEKHENIHHVDWESEEERKLAQDIHGRLKFSGITSKSSHNGYGKNTLVALLRARQVCVMPELIIPGITDAIKEIDEGMESDNEDDYFEYDSVAELNEREKQQLLTVAKQLVKIHDAGISSKMKAICQQLKENKGNGKQKLVFCQFKREIDQLERMLCSYGFNTASVDGRTTKTLRDEYLNSETIDVLILQIQTGCEGLNLQTFSEVYFVTPHWNPAIEDQAVARCHRIGQKNEVDVYRFEMRNFGKETKSLETHARNIQGRKRELYELFDK